MTLPEAMELLDYWDMHPPSHLMLAALAGFKPKKRGAGKPTKMTPISPWAGPGPRPEPVRKVAPRADAPERKKGGDLSALVALAGKRGGVVQLDDLLGM